MEKVKRQRDEFWEHFAKGEPPYEITGKYLFFSADRETLVRLALKELQCGVFFRAKISIEASGQRDYVLCLYYRDDSLKRELANRYWHVKNLKYRYWKSDEATRRGEYSKEYQG